MTVIRFITLLLFITAQNSGRFDAKRLDTTCKPCDDFNQFVNGNWVKENPVPPAYARWGTFQILQENNLKTLREILEDAARSDAARGTNEQLIGTFYASCMDEARIESRGSAPISDELDRVSKIAALRALQAEIARLHDMGMPTLFLFGASHDYQNSSQNIAWALQGGLSLPNKDYYTKTDEKSKQLREAFVKHAARMFELLGDTPDQASAAAGVIMKMEMQLADVSMDPVERRDPTKQDNKRTVAQLRMLTPDFSWTDYLAARGIPRTPTVNIAQLKFFEGMNQILKTVPLAEWKTYLRWRVLH